MRAINNLDIHPPLVRDFEKSLSKAEKSKDGKDHHHETDNPNDLVHGFSSIALSDATPVDIR
jgi:hypothetical protein